MWSLAFSTYSSLKNKMLEVTGENIEGIRAKNPGLAGVAGACPPCIYTAVAA